MWRDDDGASDTTELGKPAGAFSKLMNRLVWGTLIIGGAAVAVIICGGG